MMRATFVTTVGCDAYGRRVVERLQQSRRHCGAVQKLQNIMGSRVGSWDDFDWIPGRGNGSCFRPKCL